MFLSFLPLSHSYEHTAGLWFPIAIGAQIYYAEGMEMMRFFWDVVQELQLKDADLDEGLRFTLARPDHLEQLFEGAGLSSVQTTPIEIATRFEDFDDFWTPFLGGTGSAPTYVASLTQEDRDRVRDRLDADLPRNVDGSIHLRAKAWAVRGRVV